MRLQHPICRLGSGSRRARAVIELVDCGIFFNIIANQRAQGLGATACHRTMRAVTRPRAQQGPPPVDRAWAPGWGCGGLARDGEAQSAAVARRRRRKPSRGPRSLTSCGAYPSRQSGTSSYLEFHCRASSVVLAAKDRASKAMCTGRLQAEPLTGRLQRGPGPSSAGAATRFEPLLPRGRIALRLKPRRAVRGTARDERGLCWPDVRGKAGRGGRQHARNESVEMGACLASKKYPIRATSAVPVTD